MADPRCKIARDAWGRILDHGSWICHIEIQQDSFQESHAILDLGSAILKFNMVSMFQYGPPQIQDSFQESRAILDLGSAILKCNIASIFQYGPP